MHYRLECVIPPTDDVEAAITKLLKPFDENYVDEDGERSKYAFWDYWVIGGRYSGRKLENKLGDERMRQFHDRLTEEGVTVSGAIFGKQELSPASQIQKVDALWREYFPESGLEVCPIFQHSNDQYDSKSTLPGDVCTLGEIDFPVTALRVIIANAEGEAAYMAQEDFYNGVNFVASTWDKTLQSALSNYDKKLENYRDEWRAKNLLSSDWLVVTVDYHS